MFSNVQTTSCRCPFFLFLFSILKSKKISQIFELVYIAGACKTFCLGNQASIFKKKNKIPFLSKNKVCRGTEIETLGEKHQSRAYGTSAMVHKI